MNAPALKDGGSCPNKDDSGIARGAMVFTVVHVLTVVSQTDTGDEQRGLPDQLRTVTTDIGMHPHGEMNLIGGLIGVVLLILVLPLVPVVVLGWLLMKIVGRPSNQQGEQS